MPTWARGAQVVDLTIDEEDEVDIKTEPASTALSHQERRDATLLGEVSKSRVSTETAQDDDEDDLRDELREIQIRRKLRAIEKRKMSTVLES